MHACACERVHERKRCPVQLRPQSTDHQGGVCAAAGRPLSPSLGPQDSNRCGAELPVTGGVWPELSSAHLSAICGRGPLL